MTELTPEVLKNLRGKAEASASLGGYKEGDAWLEECPPAMVLALLDRIESLETELYETQMGEDL